jgi:hypothetical protein
MEAELFATLNKTEYSLGLTRMRPLPCFVMKTGCTVPNLCTNKQYNHSAHVATFCDASSKYKLRSSEALIRAEHLYRGKSAEADRNSEVC